MQFHLELSLHRWVVNNVSQSAGGLQTVGRRRGWREGWNITIEYYTWDKPEPLARQQEEQGASYICSNIFITENTQNNRWSCSLEFKSYILRFDVCLIHTSTELHHSDLAEWRAEDEVKSMLKWVGGAFSNTGSCLHSWPAHLFSFT